MAALTVCVGQGTGLLGVAAPTLGSENRVGERPSAVTMPLPCGIPGLPGKHRVWWSWECHGHCRWRTWEVTGGRPAGRKLSRVPQCPDIPPDTGQVGGSQMGRPCPWRDLWQRQETFLPITAQGVGATGIGGQRPGTLQASQSAQQHVSSAQTEGPGGGDTPEVVARVWDPLLS